jgi:hypothetical protein
MGQEQAKLVLHFEQEDGDDISHQNVEHSPNYTALQPGRPYPSSDIPHSRSKLRHSLKCAVTIQIKYIHTQAYRDNAL